MIARDLMTSAPFAVRENESVRRAAELMREHDVGFLPVLSDGTSGTLSGVLTDRDIAIRGVARALPTDSFVATVMSKPPLATVRPESPAEEVIQLMERARVRRLPVVSGDDRLIGVVALADVVRAIGRNDPNSVEALLERVSEATRAVV
jgi:CBS domain-containing protein